MSCCNTVDTLFFWIPDITFATTCCVLVVSPASPLDTFQSAYNIPRLPTSLVSVVIIPGQYFLLIVLDPPPGNLRIEAAWPVWFFITSFILLKSSKNASTPE